MKLFFSSIGKKLQVAISGILLVVFLVFHLFNNLVLFTGADNFNSMVHFLESIKPIIRVMEFGLLMLLLVHTINAIKLTIDNKKISPKVHGKPKTPTSTINSRTMAVSGSIILVFLFMHLGYIWLTYQSHAMAVNETYYDVLLRSNFGYLNHPPTAIFYIIAILSIAFHLRHGFQSAVKTFGLLNSSFVYYLGFIFWGLVPAGFIIIVLSIQIGVIQ